MARRILLVEDEPSLARLLEGYLVRAGFEVQVCQTGAEAMRLLDEEAGRWDLAVVDVTLPDIPGSQVAAAFHAHHPHASLIVTSGLPSSVAVEGAKFLQKPFLPRELVELLG